MSEAKQPQERELTLTLPASAVQYIYEALGERPYKEVSGLLEIIRDQVSVQNIQVASNGEVSAEAETAKEEVAA